MGGEELVAQGGGLLVEALDLFPLQFFFGSGPHAGIVGLVELDKVPDRAGAFAHLAAFAGGRAASQSRRFRSGSREVGEGSEEREGDLSSCFAPFVPVARLRSRLFCSSCFLSAPVQARASRIKTLRR